MFYIRTSNKGYKISDIPVWEARKKKRVASMGYQARELSIGLEVEAGDVPQGNAGTISSEGIIEEGEVEAGLGRSWERLHLIGHALGKYNKREYPKNNVIIGSHGMNTAMIPMERLMMDLAKSDLVVQYRVDVISSRKMQFMTKEGGKRWEKAIHKLKQTIAYQPQGSQDVVVQISQMHWDFRLDMYGRQEIPYNVKILEADKLAKDNYFNSVSRIDSIRMQIEDSVRKNIWNLVG